jgi:putative component of toxin-antitoxin plasmid stabilization module
LHRRLSRRLARRLRPSPGGEQGDHDDAGEGADDHRLTGSPGHRLWASSQALVKMFFGRGLRSICRMTTVVRFSFSISSKMRISFGYQTSARFDSL